jgi:hypothetical protein
MSAPEHGCGLCDAPLQFVELVPYVTFDGRTLTGVPTFRCTRPDCDWWHIAIDCCCGFETAKDSTLIGGGPTE